MISQSLDADSDGIPDDNECGCPFGAVLNGSFERPKFDLGSYAGFNESAVQGWRTTAPDAALEFWSEGFQDVSAASGKQFAELNANYSSALYQILCLRPGMVVRWSVQHRGRFGTDVAVVKIGASLNDASIVETMSDGLEWGQYSGTYTVPAGQTETYFIFEAVSSANGQTTTGNFIDNVEIVVTSRPPCTLDTDGDGVIDPNDLDSDNDGILDADECGVRVCAAGVIENGGFEIPVIPLGAAGGQGQASVIGWKTTAQDKIIEVWSTGAQMVPSAEGNQFVELNANVASTLYQSLCLNPGSEVEWSVKHRGRIGTDVAVVKIGPTLQTATLQETMTDGTTWGSYSGSYTVPTGQKETVFAFQAVSSSIGDASFGNFLDAVKVNLISGPDNACYDSDDDGVPNFLELDSDDDGCADAVEYYGDLAAVGTDGNNTYGNGAPPAVNAQGKVTGALYTGTISGTLLATTLTTITQQPVDIDATVIPIPVFEIETNEGSDTTSYQWQVSTDKGKTWNDVTDMMVYSGMTTKKLTVENVTPSLNGYKFRCEISQNRLVCGQFYSDTVTLLTCSNPESGGVISSDQFICLNMQPAKITSTEDATGGSGDPEYKWQVSATGESSDFIDIPGATGAEYQPPVLQVDTWYRRLAKVECKESWVEAPASNIVKMTVVPNTDRYLTIESLQQPTCNPPKGCKLTIRSLPSASWTLEQTGPVNETLTGTGNPLVIEDLPDGVYKFRTADANGCIESPPFGVIVVTY